MKKKFTLAYTNFKMKTSAANCAGNWFVVEEFTSTDGSFPVEAGTVEVICALPSTQRLRQRDPCVGCKTNSQLIPGERHRWDIHGAQTLFGGIGKKSKGLRSP